MRIVAPPTTGRGWDGRGIKPRPKGKAEKQCLEELFVSEGEGEADTFIVFNHSF